MPSVRDAAPDVGSPFRKLAVPLLIAALVAVLDQWTKAWVVRSMGLFEVKAVVPGLLNLVHVRNTGVAFSLFAELDQAWVKPLLIGTTLLAVAGVIGYLWTLPRKGAVPAALGLVLGGAVGNLVDRARLGYVVDFLELYWHRFHWPAFNVADIAISAGVFLLVLDLLSGGKEAD